jgi:ATP-binding cassette subfamily B protein
VLAAVTVVFRIRSSRAYTEARERVSVVNADFQENVAGLRITRPTAGARNAARFAGLSSSYRQSRLRAQRYIALYFPRAAAVHGGRALVLFTAASQVRSGALTAAWPDRLPAYIDLLFAPVQQLSQVRRLPAGLGRAATDQTRCAPDVDPAGQRPRFRAAARPDRVPRRALPVSRPANRRAERQPDHRARRDRGPGRPDRRRKSTMIKLVARFTT